jgi:hypothetical protein
MNKANTIMTITETIMITQEVVGIPVSSVVLPPMASKGSSMLVRVTVIVLAVVSTMVYN